MGCPVGGVVCVDGGGGGSVVYVVEGAVESFAK